MNNALTITDVVVYGRDAEGNNWKLSADEATFRLTRGGKFRGGLCRVNPWGKCEAQIIQEHA